MTVITLSYWDVVDGKKKRRVITANTDKFESEADAKQYLINKRDERLSKIKPIKIKVEKPVVEPVVEQPVVEPVVEEPVVETNKIQYTPFKLNLSDMKETGSTTVIYGASKSGKTYLLKQILKKYYSSNNVITVMFADNVHANIYRDIDKKIIKTSKFCPQLVKDIHKIQKKTNNKYTWLIILDDMVLEKSDPQLLKLFLTYRNSKISLIINLQSLSLLSKSARFNGNNFIFKKCNSQQYIDDVMRYFVGGYGVFSGKHITEQTKLFQEITKDYGFVYLDALNDEISYHKNV